MKYSLIFLLIFLSACHVVADKPALFKNKVFYGDWQHRTLLDQELGVMTVLPEKITFSKGVSYDCPRIIDQENDAVMIECYTDDKKKVFKIFKLYKASFKYKDRVYIENRHCSATHHKGVKPSLETIGDRCSLSVRFKYIGK